MMKVAVLTTETPHHAYFVRAVKDAIGTVVVFRETASGPQPPFETHHPFEDERDDYEWKRWFGGRRTKISELAPVRSFRSMNDQEAVAALQSEGADVAIVFGTGVLKAPAIEACPRQIFNLHGGDPEEYRGLDTHLWAIFLRDFGGLVTTLHRLDRGLDTGGDSPATGDVYPHPAGGKHRGLRQAGARRARHDLPLS